MRIISQNRDYSFEFANRDIRVQDGVIYMVTNTRDKVIGNYGSNGRAIQVFNEIHNMAEKEMRDLPDLMVYTVPKE